jgi:methionyl-tRNA formyltransferase
VTGASVFLLEAGLDTGPVYGTVTEPVAATDTAGDLLDRLAVSGAALLVKVLDAIGQGHANAVPQPHEGVSLAPKLTVDDAAVRWTDPAFAVDRRIRACTPAPGAWTMFHDERLKLGPVRPLPDGSSLAPGELLVERNRVLAGTATTPVVLGPVQAPGKRPMPADAWARGARVVSGERLG